MAFRIGPPPAPTPLFAKPLGDTVPPDAELFEQLLPFSWRGICVPVESLKMSLEQGLVQHKFWGVDAARVEATGREPLTLEATIPFVNGIAAGKGETWGSASTAGTGTGNSNGTLYPFVFRDFIEAMRDSSTGVLQHPEYGGITCKPVSAEIVHDAETRDGVIVVAKWVETVDADLAVDDPFKSSSPITDGLLAAIDLDSSKTNLLALLPPGASQEETFDSLINKVIGTVDTVTSDINTLKAIPNQILNRVDLLVQSLQRAKNVFTWPAIDAADRLRDSVQRLSTPDNTRTVFVSGQAKQVPVHAPGRTVGRYVVTGSPLSLSQVQSALACQGHKNSIDALIELNPGFIANPEVAQGFVVRYYV